MKSWKGLCSASPPEGHSDSRFIGSDKLRLCKVVPNLYVELRQSVLGVRVPEDIQMEGFRVK